LFGLRSFDIVVAGVELAAVQKSRSVEKYSVEQVAGARAATCLSTMILWKDKGVKVIHREQENTDE
jgi:hypothetical protein